MRINSNLIQSLNTRAQECRNAYFLGDEVPTIPEEIENLSHKDLRGADLEGANLKEINLSFADLRDVRLKGASLLGADLRGANFEGANLVQAVLWGAKVEGANLKGANLLLANFANTNITKEQRESAINAKRIYPEEGVREVLLLSSVKRAYENRIVFEVMNDKTVRIRIKQFMYW